LCIHGKETLCQENADRKQEKFPAAKSGPTSEHKIREEKLQKELRIREKKTIFLQPETGSSRSCQIENQNQNQTVETDKRKTKEEQEPCNTERRGKKLEKRVFAADRGRKSMGKNGRHKTKVGNKPTDNVYA
jgi:hypothetical protein